MLESIVANVLKTFLNEFIEIDSGGGRDLQEKVHIGAWNGYIVLEEVVLKKHLFSLLGLPISLSYGVIGRLELSIPWANLGIEPVVVMIDRVYLLLEPKYEWDPDAYRKRQQMTKQAKLAAAELFASTRLTKDGALHKYGDMAKKWLLDSFMAKAVNNIQVTIREVHIRYEDHVSVDSSPFCFGFTLESLHVSNSSFFSENTSGSKGGSSSSEGPLSTSSSPEPGEESFGMKFDGADSFRKLVEMSHFSVYWNPLVMTAAKSGGGVGSSELSSSNFKNLSRADIERLMSRTIAKRQHQLLDRPKHHYILHPTNISVKLDVSLDATLGGAKCCARCVVSDVAIVFEDHQYREIALLCANMSNFMQLERFSGIRPLVTISESAAANDGELSNVVKAWWRYAIQAEIAKLNNPYYQTCSTHMKQKKRIQDQLVYVELWKSKLLGQAKGKSDTKTLDRAALFQDLCLLSRKRRAATQARRLASSSSADVDKPRVAVNPNNSLEPVRPLRDDMAALLADLEEKLSYEQIIYFRSLAENDLTYDDPKSSWLGNWVQWASGGRMDDRKLLEALKADPDRVMSGMKWTDGDQEPSAVFAAFTLSLRKGSVTIALSKPLSLAKVTQSSTDLYIPFLEISLSSVQTVVLAKGNGENTSLNLSMTLQSMSVYEIVPSAEAGGWGRACVAERRCYGASISSTSSTASPETPLFEMNFEIQPAGKKLLSATLQQLQIMISPVSPWITQIIAWSSLYPEELVAWQKHQLATINQLENYTAKLAAKLEQMVSSGDSLWITATINAPVVVLSGAGTPGPAGSGKERGDGFVSNENEILLILDLGQVRITTAKLAKDDHIQALRVNSTGFISDGTQTTYRGGRDESRSSRGTRKYEREKRRKHARRSANESQIVEGSDEDEDDPQERSHSIASGYSLGNDGRHHSASYVGESTISHGSNGGEYTTNASNPAGSYEIDDGDDAADAADRHQNNEDLDADEGFYDVFDVQVSEIEVYLCSLKNWFAPPATSAPPLLTPTKLLFGSKSVEPAYKIGIVDKFDVSMKVHISVVFYDATISTCQLDVSLPDINIRLSQAKLLSLVQFGESFCAPGKIDSAYSDHSYSLSRVGSGSAMATLIAASEANSAANSGSESSQSSRPDARPLDSQNSPSADAGIETVLRGTAGRVEEVLEVLDAEDDDEFFDVAESARASGMGPLDTSSDDDDFQSVDEEDPVLAQQQQLCDSLQQEVRLKEQLVSSLMSKVRVAETNDTSSSDKALLVDELRQTEDLLQGLKVKYVESCMALESLNPNSWELSGARSASSSRPTNYQHLAPLPFEEESNMRGGVLDITRGQLPYNRPAPQSKQLGRQWLRCEVNLSYINVELRAPVEAPLTTATPRGTPKTTPIKPRGNGMRTSPEKSRRESKREKEEQVVLRLKIGGISAQIKYDEDSASMLAAKITLAVREVDVEDILASQMSHRNYSAAQNEIGSQFAGYASTLPSVFLLSSEPSLPWLAQKLRLISPWGAGGDLLTMKYSLISSPATGVASPKAQHRLRLEFRFVELNIEQSTIAALLALGSNVSSAITRPSATRPQLIQNVNRISSDNGSAIATEMAPFPCIDFKCKGHGVSLSLYERSLPLCTLSLWACAIRGEMRADNVFVDLKLKDLSIHHHVERPKGKEDETQLSYPIPHLVLGRTVENEEPYLSIYFKLAQEAGRGRTFTPPVVTASTSIHIAAIQINLVPSFIHAIATAIADGAIVTQMTTMSLAPSSPTFIEEEVLVSVSASVSESIEGVYKSLAGVVGKIEYIGGRVDFKFPYNYITQVQRMPTSDLSSSSLEDFDRSAEVLHVAIGSTSMCLFFGRNVAVTADSLSHPAISPSQTGGIQMISAICDSFIKVGSATILERFDVHAHARLVRDFSMAGDVCESAFVPPYKALLPSHETGSPIDGGLHFALRVSPLRWYVSERRIALLYRWVNITGSPLTRKLAPQDDSAPSMNADPVLPIAKSHATLLDLFPGVPCVVTMGIQEVAVCFDTDIGELAPNHNGESFAICSSEGVFLLSVRDIGASLTNSNSPRLASGARAVCAVLHVSSVDFDYLKALPDTPRRMLATTRPTIADDSQMLTASLSLSSALDCMVDASVCHVQAVLLTDAAVTLSVLLELYAAHASINPTPFSPVTTAQETARSGLAMLMELRRKANAPQNDSKSTGSSRPHPSSLPLSTVETGNGAQSSAMDEQVLEGREQAAMNIVIHQNALALPLGLASFNVRFSMLTCALHIPIIGMPMNKSKSKEMALYIGADVNVMSGFKNIVADSTRDEIALPSEGSRSSHARDVWSTKFTMTSVSVAVQRIPYMEIHEPIGTVVAASAVDQASTQVLIAPFSVEACHDISVVTEFAAPEDGMNGILPAADDEITPRAFQRLAQTVTVFVQEVQLLFFLDYRMLVELSSMLSAFNAGFVNEQVPDKRSQNTHMSMISTSTDRVRASCLKPDSVFSLLPLTPYVGSLEATLSQEGIALYIINDLYQPHVAVARFTVSPITANAIFAETVSASISFSSAAAEYHNQSLTCWEPLLEPFGVAIEYVGEGIVPAKVEWRLSLGTNSSSNEPFPSDSTADEDGSIPAEMPPGVVNVHAPLPGRLDVSVRGTMNVNLTMPLLETLMGTIMALQSLSPGTERPSCGSIRSIQGMTIQNETGVSLCYWASNKSADRVHAPKHIVLANEKASLVFDGEAADGSHFGNYETLISSRKVRLGMFSGAGSTLKVSSTCDIGLEGRGCRILSLVSSSQSPRSLTPQPTTIITELHSKAGIKTLLVRSTLRIVNQSTIPIRVLMVSGSRSKSLRESEGRETIFDCTLPPSESVPVPAIFCDIPNGRILFQPVLDPVPANNHIDSRQFSLAAFNATEIPLPLIPGMVGANVSDNGIDSDGGDSSDSESEQLDGNEERQQKSSSIRLKNSRNSVQRRKKLLQSRGAVDTLSYSYWCHFYSSTLAPTISPPSQSTGLNCNINVVTKGAPRSHSRPDQTFENVAMTETVMSRIVTICAPVSVTNLLACTIDVVLIPDDLLDSECSLMQSNARSTLQSGESYSCLAFHSTEGFGLALRMHGNSGLTEWSSLIRISRSKRVRSELKLDCHVECENGAPLAVQADFSDLQGSRILSLYTPYWVITQSFLPLHFSHDASSGLNGSDGLAADQEFEKKAPAPPVAGVTTTAPGFGSNRQRPARGTFGILLGPEAPIRGLADVLLSSKGVSPFGRHLPSLRGSAGKVGVDKRINSIIRGAAESDMRGTDGASIQNHTLMHCGYTRADRRKAQLKMRCKSLIGPNERHGGYDWSRPFSLDSLGSTSTEIKSKTRGRAKKSSASSGQMSGMSGDDCQIFSFGITTTPADAPFNRTKIVLVVDRFILVNMLSYSLEVRQFGCENELLSVRPGEDVPMWWRPRAVVGSPPVYTVQIRLCQYGWSWSGRFALVEGEIPLRMRNEHDNTVLFILIQVLLQGPRISIIFRGGEHAPFRIENHTLDTFKLQQLASGPSYLSSYQATSEPTLPVTSLLPYHVAAYAWDEPLQPHKLSLQMLTSTLLGETSGTGGAAGLLGVSPNTAGSHLGHSSYRGVRNEWRACGTYTFDRLSTTETADFVGSDGFGSAERDKEQSDIMAHVLIRIIARGPTRVLQILDRRNLSRLPLVISSPRLTHGETVRERTTSGSMLSFLPESTRLPKQGPAPTLRIFVHLDNFGLSIVDHVPQELLFLSVRDVSVSYTTYKSADSLRLQIAHVQLDSQIWSTPYPAILYPLRRETGDIDASDESGLDNFVLFEMRREFSYPSIVLIPYLSIHVMPFDVNLEGTILSRLAGFGSAVIDAYFQESQGASALPGALMQDPSRNYARDDRENFPDDSNALQVVSPTQTRSRAVSVNDHRNGCKGQARVVRDIVQAVLTLAAPPRTSTDERVAPHSKFYIQKLLVSDLRMNISLNPVILKEHGQAESFLDSKIHSESVWINALTTLLLAVGSTFAKIDNSALRFRSFEAIDMFGSWAEIGSRMLGHYLPQAKIAAILIALSSEALGNPIQLFRTIAEGMWDFLYLPAMGLITSPGAFGIGIVRGTSSLIRRTLASLLTTMCHFSASAQIGLSALGVIDPYLGVTNGTEIQRRLLLDKAQWDVLGRGPDIVGRPRGLVDGIMLGLQGLLTAPYLGLRSGGINGLFVGLVHGALGMVAKPVYGLLTITSRNLDLFSFKLLPRVLGEHKHKLRRSRPPRFFSASNLPLSVYSADENTGSELLSRVHSGQFRCEGFVWYSRLKDNRIVILTSVRVLVVGESNGFCELIWQCPLQKILFLELEATRSLAIADQYLESPMKILDYNPVSYTSPMKGALLRQPEGRPTTPLSSRSSLRSPPRSSSKGLVRASDREEEKAILDKIAAATPVLKIFHLPSPAMTSLKTRSSPSSSGLRIDSDALYLFTQESLLIFLSQLLKIHPHLAGDSVRSYLEQRGVAFQPAQPGVNNGAISFASPLLGRRPLLG